MPKKFLRSLKTTQVKEPEFPYIAEQVSSPESAALFLKSLETFDNEKAVCLFLDTKNKVVGVQIMEGTLDMCPVYPREIIKHAFLHCASAVIVAHNHPSGNLTPSNADKSLNRLLYDAFKSVGLRYLDFMILSEEGFYSFANEGELERPRPLNEADILLLKALKSARDLINSGSQEKLFKGQILKEINTAIEKAEFTPGF